MPSHGPYPDTAEARDRWILARRGPRNRLNPFQPYAWLTEEEPRKNGALTNIATVFLTNRECPWRCLMCDLWRNTLIEIVPSGAIPAQIDFALGQLPAAREIKLYNAGSFFDERAVPASDYRAIAERLREFERVIVECHPSLIGENCLRFREMLPGRLQIAIGLETIHPEVLPRLNKRMTLDRFERACQFLRQHHVELRVFVLLKPPFLTETEGRVWAERSIEFAFRQGAQLVSVIPTRRGNGALETLAAHGQFEPPTLASLEAVLEFGLNLRQGIVLADVWDLETLAGCSRCYSARRARIEQMNRRQEILPPVPCAC